LLRIAINRAKDVLKSKRSGARSRFPPTAREARPCSRTIRASRGARGQAEDRRRLQGRAFDLPPKYREVLVLKDVEGLAYEEIRPILRLSIPALRSA